MVNVLDFFMSCHIIEECDIKYIVDQLYTENVEFRNIDDCSTL